MPEPTSNGPEGPDESDLTDDDDAPAGFEMRLGRTFRVGRQVPDDVLPPETIARLRAGGEITPEEMARVRAAALGGGFLGSVVDALASHGDSVARSPGTHEDFEAAAGGDGPDAIVVPGGTRSYSFEWRRDRDLPDEPAPATYYETLTGEPDPHRDVIITVRRVINLLVWLIVLGVPAVLVVLASASGQSAQTVVVIGVFALIVGLMFRDSLPRSPFG